MKNPDGNPYKLEKNYLNDIKIKRNEIKRRGNYYVQQIQK